MSGLTELALLSAGVGNHQDRGQQRKQRARPHGGAARAGEGPARRGLLHAAAAAIDPAPTAHASCSWPLSTPLGVATPQTSPKYLGTRLVEKVANLARNNRNSYTLHNKYVYK